MLEIWNKIRNTQDSCGEGLQSFVWTKNDKKASFQLDRMWGTYVSNKGNVCYKVS